MRPEVNRESCDCFAVGSSSEAAHAERPGAFYIDPNGMAIWIKTPDMRAVRLPLDGSRGWRWDGNREKPTITPSILNFDQEADGTRHELWHGFLRAGRLESC